MFFSRGTSYIRSDATGEKIERHRRGGTFVMKLRHAAQGKTGTTSIAKTGKDRVPLEIYGGDEVNDPHVEPEDEKVVSGGGKLEVPRPSREFRNPYVRGESA